MELKCTQCGDNIDSRLANIRTNMIQCPNCFTIHELDKLVKQQNNKVQSYASSYTSTEVTELREKPRGSKLEVLSTYSNFEISAPPVGFQAMDTFITIFAVIWLSFISFWTFMAARGFLPMAFFSIPFWLVGFGLAGGLIKKWTERQFIEVNNRFLTIRKRGILFSKTQEIPLEHIDLIDMKKAKLKNTFSNLGKMSELSNTNGRGKNLVQPTIQVGVKDYTFLENFQEVEQQWATQSLKTAVEQIKDGRW